MHPRLVKEADTLSEEGYSVRVCAGQYMDGAMEADETILRRANWRVSFLCLKSDERPYLFLKSRIRHRLCRQLIELFWPINLTKTFEKLICCAYEVVFPELLGLALEEPADLYIAHDLRALPVAVIAARLCQAKVGFDAEDFYSGKERLEKRPNFTRALKEYVEQRYLGQCDYVTAGSPAIAEAYAAKYGVPKPVFILNVFPLSQRPSEFRHGNTNTPLTLYWFSRTIGARRGLEDIVRAMGLLKGHQIDLHLRGAWYNGYRKELLRLATTVGLDSQRIIIHPPGPPEEMVRLANPYDVGLAIEPGAGENNQIALSNKLFTYLLAGNAVIATNTKGQQAVTKSLRCAAYCYEPGDVNMLARHLKFLLENRRLLEESRRQAWDWGTRQYNWDLEKRKFLRVVKEVLVGDQVAHDTERVFVSG